MPTENPRITITMSEKQLEDIRNYLHENKLKNQTQAILSLINKGFDALNANSADSSIQVSKKASAMPTNALENELIDNFRSLNAQGQRMLCELSGAMVDSGHYSTRNVGFAARGGQHADVNLVENLDDLLPPEDSSDI